MRPSEWRIGLTFVALLALLPLLGRWSRQAGEPKCAYDGAALEPMYRARIVENAGAEADFCCIRCAELWLRSRPAKLPPRIFVTDESTGEQIAAGLAYFVRSQVVTTRTTG